MKILCSVLAAVCLLQAPAAVSGAEPVQLGAALPLSGPNALAGQIQRDSILLALEDLNGRGGINGRPLQVEIRDTGGRPDAARAILETFVRNRSYPLVLGGASSRDAYEMARLSDRMGVPLLVAGAAREAITSPGYGNTFRLNPPLSMYPSGVLEFVARRLPVRRIALLAENTPYGDSMAEQVRRLAASMGTAPPFVVRYEPATLNLQGALAAVAAAAPDLVFLASFPPDAARLVTELREAGIGGAKVVGLSPYFATASFCETVGDACEGLLSGAIWTRGTGYPGADRYFTRYVERYGHEPDYRGAEAYAAIQVAADALRRAQETTPQALRKALDETSILTVFGPVSFPAWESFRNQNRAQTLAVQWIGGQAKVVWPRDLASADPVPGGRP